MYMNSLSDKLSLATIAHNRILIVFSVDFNSIFNKKPNSPMQSITVTNRVAGSPIIPDMKEQRKYNYCIPQHIHLSVTSS